jgi:acetylornithine deacetylase/succinyl-diaminopimelate desuccinylase-like protein
VSILFVQLIFEKRIHLGFILLICIHYSLSTCAQEDRIQWIHDKKDVAADQLIRIGSIISPSGEEELRAEAVAEIMYDFGLQFISIDSLYNVQGMIKGKSDSVIVLISTLDDLATVASWQRQLNRPLYRVDDHIIGPGANTSSTIISMLIAAQAIMQSGQIPDYTLVFAAVSREETGLDGMKKIYKSWKHRAVGFVDILGEGTSISNGAIGIHWHKVVGYGPPGHTLRGGLPNVNYALSQAIQAIFELQISQEWKDQRTFLNIAMIQSGAVFNHKPEMGWFSLDMRSLSQDILDTLTASVRQILLDVSLKTNIKLELVPESITPGGQIVGADDHRLTRVALEARSTLGLSTQILKTGSSNMNIPIASGSMAIGLNGERGGRRGHEDEWADLDALITTAKIVYLIATLY